MTDLYQKVEQFIIDSCEKAGKASQVKHFERTVYWLKELKPDADESLLISAIAHDIERAFRKDDMIIKKKKVGFTSLDFLRPHQEQSAEIIVNFLEKQGAEKKIIERVKMLVSRHEEGGNEDQNLLKDVGSISFFENNIPIFLDNIAHENNKEKVREKFNWMHKRITSDKAKEIAKNWYEKALSDLENIVIRVLRSKAPQ